jgi:phosphate transport system substrate-binding protein
LATVPEGEPVAMAAAADAPMAAQAVLIELDPALPDYASEVVLEERLRTAGSDTMDRLMRLWEQEFQQWHPQVVIRHEGKGSSTAIPALLEGLSHFGAMSRPLKRAEILEFQSEFGYEPIQLCVAIDALAVYAHPSNPIVQRGLTLAELDAVFSSTRKRGYPNDLLRWGQLLGDGERWSEAPIRAYGRTAVSGTYSVFQEAVLRGGTYRRTNHDLVGSAEVV